IGDGRDRLPPHPEVLQDQHAHHGDEHVPEVEAGLLPVHINPIPAGAGPSLSGRRVAPLRSICRLTAVRGQCEAEVPNTCIDQRCGGPNGRGGSPDATSSAPRATTSRSRQPTESTHSRPPPPPPPSA